VNALVHYSGYQVSYPSHQGEIKKKATPFTMQEGTGTRIRSVVKKHPFKRLNLVFCRNERKETHQLYPLYPAVSHWCWSLLWLKLGERLCTPWTGYQLVAETHTHRHPFKVELESPINLTQMSFYCGSRTRRKRRSPEG